MKLKRVLIGGVCVLIAGGGIAQAQKITNPDWASRPDGRQVAEAYPPLAMQMRIEGRSTLSCTVSTEGRLRNCVAMATTPTGLGFDSGALKLSESFRMTPKMEDGRPKPSGTVRIPIRFVLPKDGQGDAGAPPVIGAPTSPAAAKLAARLAPLLTRDMIALQDIAAEIGLEAAGGGDQQSGAARQAVNDGTKAVAPAWGVALADAYAATMTETELQAMLDFVSSQTGNGLETRRGRVLAAQLPIQDQFIWTIAALARAKFCAQAECRFDRWRPPEDVALVNPPWSRQPTEIDVQSMAPPITNLLGLSGWAQINCIVQPSGGLDSCVAVRESPTGLHFGAAALQLSEAYEIDSAKVDRAVSGEIVAVLVNSNPNSFSSHTPDSRPRSERQGKAPSEEAMSLARRIVEADTTMQPIDDLADQLRIPTSVPGANNPELLGAQALVEAIQESRNALAEQMAKTYAVEYTPAELRRILDFRVGPGGQAMKRLDPNLLAAIERFYGAQASAEARRRFCADRECEPAAAKAAAS